MVMACCGDLPTLETLAAVDLLRQYLPELRVRVINVVDLMPLWQRMDDARLHARRYTREHGEDAPDISGWTWPYDREGHRIGPAPVPAATTGERGGTGARAPAGRARWQPRDDRGPAGH